jgi:hypothetical protein
LVHVGTIGLPQDIQKAASAGFAAPQE